MYLSQDLTGADSFKPYKDNSWNWKQYPSFDWRYVDVAGKSCVHEIRNQGSCGSCWSFGTSEFLSDRLCIKSEGKVDTVLSPQFLVDCDTEQYPESGETGGCEGAMTQVVVDWIAKNGITYDACYPYFSGDTKKAGDCH